ITAYDFEYTWKKILQPSFKSPFSSLLYSIKNAKAVKEGFTPLDKLGVYTLDEKTLLVELESPTPHFLELTANALYSPVNHRIDQMYPDWASRFGEGYVCNGPFILRRRTSKQYELEKNPYYWDIKAIQLDEIMIYKTDPYDALAMFTTGKIDWLGRPLRPWEPFFSKSLPNYSHRSAATVHWCVFNVECFPLNHIKIRQALASAICRQEIIQSLSTDLIPAKTPLPQEHSQWVGTDNYEEHQVRAQNLFQEALRELGIDRERFPILTFICLKGNIRETTALILKKQWEETLGIYCRVEAYDWNTLFDKMSKGDYQIGGMTWQSLINDPFYTLNSFKYRADQINFSKWESLQYQALLDTAERERHIERRNQYFSQAEALLIKEMPLVPIYYEPEKFIKRDDLEISLS
ncbi:MAG: peptide ABC transporter substrate-binding protein, partial [Rhabdochlamydiaceae bacterium]